MLGTLVGRRLDGRTNSDPHGRVQSGRLKSVVWTVYYFIDFVAGHWLVLRPATRQGKLVVIERGWDDMRADPRRYGLRGTRLTRLLTPLVPRPDITVVLNAPSDVVQARKCELPTGEIERQLEVWRSYGRSRRATLLVDARRSVEDLTAEILAATSHNATHR
jgi:thymidylate kinase